MDRETMRLVILSAVEKWRDACLVLHNHEHLKNFPEDRVGGDRWLSNEEIRARGWLLM